MTVRPNCGYAFVSGQFLFFNHFISDYFFSFSNYYLQCNIFVISGSVKIMIFYVKCILLCFFIKKVNRSLFDNTAGNKSIPAIWADSYILSIISLIFFGFRVDRLLIRLCILLRSQCPGLVWYFQESLRSLISNSIGRTQQQIPKLTGMLDVACNFQLRPNNRSECIINIILFVVFIF